MVDAADQTASAVLCQSSTSRRKISKRSYFGSRTGLFPSNKSRCDFDRFVNAPAQCPLGASLRRRSERETTANPAQLGFSHARSHWRSPRLRHLVRSGCMKIPTTSHNARSRNPVGCMLRTDQGDVHLLAPDARPEAGWPLGDRRIEPLNWQTHIFGAFSRIIPTAAMMSSRAAFTATKFGPMKFSCRRL